jgi:arsenite-transporting ATPase
MRIILYSGKGGVGKTSLSAATAVRSARLGRKTLVVSTDAAHSLADALAVEVGGTPTRIAPNLFALEIDVNRELADHWGVIQEWLTRFMTFQGVGDAVAEEMAILPGMEELFSLIKVKRYAEAEAYDVIVIDCAPTGETIRMLAAPEILTFYFKRIFPIQKTVLRSVRPVAKRVTDLPLPSDDVLTAVKAIYDELEGMGPLLQDPRKSTIRIVLNPERMVINESQRLYTYLNLFGFPVDAVVANRVLPPEARSVYFDKWFSIQAGHLAEARRAFDPLPFFEARLFDREMVGTELLERFAHDVFGDADPTKVLFQERPVEVKKEGRSYALYIRLPFAQKDQIEVWTHGEELVVSVDNQRRHILLPRTLASRKLTGAAFADQKLRVGFGEKESHDASR